MRIMTINICFFKILNIITIMIIYSNEQKKGNKMSNKERVNIQSLYDWITSTIENYGDKYGSLVFQSDWIPLPDYFFNYKNDKIFSSAIHISYDDEYFSFGISTLDYVEPIGGCSLKSVMNNDGIFKKDALGFMLESLLNRQEDNNKNNIFVLDIKRNIEDVVKGNVSYFYYTINDYLHYSEKEEKELLKNTFTFKNIEIIKSKNKVLKDINKNADEIYKQKYNELCSLFYSPDTEKYPQQEVIEPENLKINGDLLKKGSHLVINGIKYKVGEDVILKNHKEDFFESSAGKEIDIKVTHKGQVYLYRESDNNLYSMDIYIKKEKDKKGNNMYYLDEIIEEQLYIHNVTINLPKDDRPLTVSSYFIDLKFKEMYKDYNSEKAYKRKDFVNYPKEIIHQKSINEEILNIFKNEFKNNKDLLIDDFDVRKWSDNVIYTNFGLNLSIETSKPSVRKRKM